MCEHKWGPWKQLEDRAIGDECGNFDKEEPKILVEERRCRLCPEKETRRMLLKEGERFDSPCDVTIA
jgi:hypothetical protein